MRFLVCLLLLLPSRAHAWGLSTELNESWATARIVYAAVQRKKIVYCLKNQAADRFDSASIATQVESALHLWLAAAHADDVAIEGQSACAGNFDLLVQIGEETQYKGLGSYQLSSWDDTHYYSLVKFDTEFTSEYQGTKASISDFRRFAADGVQALISRVSREKPQTVYAFAQEQGFPAQRVFWSTYPSLIHELGHAFGLCDTYDAPTKDQCDPAYSSAVHPSSVMKDSTYFYLTEDDITAIQRLFQRYR